MSPPIVKHPKWRFPGVEALDPDDLAALVAGARYCLAHYPFADDIRDIEIVGSYARFCAKPWSDFDLNAVIGTTWESQFKARAVLMAPAYGRIFRDRLGALMESAGVSIQIAISTPDQKTYNTLYSSAEGRFYGKEPFEVRDESCQWDIETMRWKPGPPKAGSAWSIPEDPYAASIVSYAAFPHYQDIAPYIVGG